MQNNSLEFLRIYEIYFTLQGEGLSTGLPTIIVRLSGCPFSCSWCDTKYARGLNSGKELSIDKVMETIDRFFVDKKRSLSVNIELTQFYNILVTGGEPLFQEGTIELLKRLSSVYSRIELETSGLILIKDIPERVSIIMDLKPPSSAMVEKIVWQNLDYLKLKDQLKFVIGSRGDYEWAKRVILERRLAGKVNLLFSPVWNKDSIFSEQLSQWIIEDGLPVRFQVQLHKLIWGRSNGEYRIDLI